MSEAEPVGAEAVGAERVEADSSAVLHHNDCWHGHQLASSESYQEWMHFCLSSSRHSSSPFHAIVNFSLTRDEALKRIRGRVTVLCRTGLGKWRSAFEETDAVVLDPSGHRLCAGAHRVEYAGGRYHVSVRFPEVRIDVQLLPCSEAYVKNRIRLGEGHAFGWLVVPRLHVTGSLAIDGASHTLLGAMAYHDHNWGCFDWGSNFGWEWGFSCFDESAAAGSSDTIAPRTDVVFVRVGDRGRRRTLTQALLLWREGRLVRAFREEELSVRRTGLLRQSDIITVPRVMRLLAPGSASDVPKSMDVKAHSGSDQLALHFQATDVARIVVPHAADLGVTAVNETFGTLTLGGRVHERNIQRQGHANFEFLS